jgi:hypothetical protein
MDALARETSEAEADGKNVWSRSPDAGVKLAKMFAGDGGNKARFTEESTR